MMLFIRQYKTLSHSRIYAMYFRLPAVGRLCRPTFAENDNLITIDIVNN